MSRKNYWYFRSTDTLTDDDLYIDSIMICVDDIVGFQALGDTNVAIYHKNQGQESGGLPNRVNEVITLTIESNTVKTVMKALAAATNGPTHHDGTTVIGDDVNSIYLIPEITAVSVIGASDRDALGSS